MKNLEQLNLAIEKQNEAFNKMSKADKRVQIAKDCIARLKFKQLNAQTGVVISVLQGEYEEEDSLKDVMCNEELQCSVCAKGGLFLTYVGRVNKVLMGDVRSDNELESKEMKKLMEIFTAKQLTMIETTFEGYTPTGEQFMSDTNFDKCLAFYNSTDTHEETLIKICENIIKNKGTFKP